MHGPVNVKFKFLFFITYSNQTVQVSFSHCFITSPSSRPLGGFGWTRMDWNWLVHFSS